MKYQDKYNKLLRHKYVPRTRRCVSVVPGGEEAEGAKKDLVDQEDQWDQKAP